MPSAPLKATIHEHLHFPFHQSLVGRRLIDRLSMQAVYNYTYKYLMSRQLTNLWACSRRFTPDSLGLTFITLAKEPWFER